MNLPSCEGWLIAIFPEVDGVFANLEQTIIVGAGISGVAAAVLLSKKVRNHTVKVYEKNSRVVSLLEIVICKCLN